MKRVLSLDDDGTTLQTRQEVGTYFVSSVGFSHSLTQVTAMVTLLLEHGKDEQAELVSRGELTGLDLEGCEIGDDGAETVASFLKGTYSGSGVRTVVLDHCNIGLRGFKALAEMLKLNDTVEDIYLQMNRIERDCLVVLNEAISVNACITYVNAYSDVTVPKLLASIEYLTEMRNKILIPNVVRRASLCLIAASRIRANAGDLAIFPREIVRMIAMQVWATRRDSLWIEAASDDHHKELKKKWLKNWILNAGVNAYGEAYIFSDSEEQ